MGRSDAVAAATLLDQPVPKKKTRTSVGGSGSGSGPAAQAGTRGPAAQAGTRGRKRGSIVDTDSGVVMDLA